MSQFYCRDNELRKLNKRYAGDKFECMRFNNPVSGTRMKTLTRCLWRDTLTRRQDEARIRIISKD